MYMFIGSSLLALFAAVYFDDTLIPAQPLTNPVVLLFSFIPFIVLAAAILFFLIYLKKSKRVSALLTITASAILFTVQLLKIIFERARPNPAIHTYSFPSGHATFVFTLVPFAFYYDKRAGWVYLAFAVLVSLSRILLRAHYLSDVVAGGIFGFSISWIFAAILKQNRKSALE